MIEWVVRSSKRQWIALTHFSPNTSFRNEVAWDAFSRGIVGGGTVCVVIAVGVGEADVMERKSNRASKEHGTNLELNASRRVPTPH